MDSIHFNPLEIRFSHWQSVTLVDADSIHRVRYLSRTEPCISLHLAACLGRLSLDRFVLVSPPANTASVRRAKPLAQERSVLTLNHY